MAYNMGYCPQCGVQIQVQDANGVWASCKPNYTQMDLFFEDGHRCRTMICKSCAEKPDYKKLMEAITHQDSTASSPDVLEALKKRGVPTGSLVINNAKDAMMSAKMGQLKKMEVIRGS